MTGLSVVVPTKDKPESLRATLACLLAAAAPPVEIVVVDEGDAPVTAPADPAVRVVEGPRRGRAAARNAGARAASGTRLLFVDDDILTGPGFLAAHAAHGTGPGFVHGPLMEFPGARRWLAAVGPDPVAAAAVVGGAERLVRNNLEAAVLAVAAGAAPARLGWLACVGANLSLSRAAFDQVGGFDEGFGTRWGCEDLELGVRLLAAGHRPTVDPGAPGVHLTHARPDRWEQHEVTHARFAALHDTADVRALPLLLTVSQAAYFEAVAP
ncbi:glycosyltransferase family 2 protein [Streptomyces sp. NRRL S-350]|uniref:glycosyltransferase family 2 protein n=1 Tax=Streptomyces sp. NRRL S-350 TaxID=1463902 RepID=UPI0004BFCE9A|nr:glycosyltransferase [Streptomyces sp. NRRL S-350]